MIFDVIFFVELKKESLKSWHNLKNVVHPLLNNSLLLVVDSCYIFYNDIENLYQIFNLLTFVQLSFFFNFQKVYLEHHFTDLWQLCICLYCND